MMNDTVATTVIITAESVSKRSDHAASKAPESIQVIGSTVIVRPSNATS